MLCYRSAHKEWFLLASGLLRKKSDLQFIRRKATQWSMVARGDDSIDGNLKRATSRFHGDQEHMARCRGR